MSACRVEPGFSHGSSNINDNPMPGPSNRLSPPLILHQQNIVTIKSEYSLNLDCVKTEELEDIKPPINYDCAYVRKSLFGYNYRPYNMRSNDDNKMNHRYNLRERKPIVIIDLTKKGRMKMKRRKKISSEVRPLSEVKKRYQWKGGRRRRRRRLIKEEEVTDHEVDEAPEPVLVSRIAGLRVRLQTPANKHPRGEVLPELTNVEKLLLEIVFRKLEYIKERPYIYFMPSVYQREARTSLHCNLSMAIDKKYFLACIEFFFSRLIEQYIITDEEKDLYIEQLKHGFYYPGSIVIEPHYRSVDQFFQNATWKEYMDADILFITHEILTMVQIGYSDPRACIVYTMSCLDCEEQIVERTQDGENLEDSGRKVCQTYNLMGVCSCWDGGHRHRFDWREMITLRTCHPKLGEYLKEVERQCLEARGFRVFKRNQKLEISEGWKCIWSYRYTKEDYFGYYYWIHRGLNEHMSPSFEEFHSFVTKQEDGESNGIHLQVLQDDLRCFCQNLHQFYEGINTEYFNNHYMYAHHPFFFFY